MDIHLTSAQATPEERAAVDSELGEPAIGWQGGQRATQIRAQPFNDDSRGRSGHLLLPALHAIQNRIGWISPGALNYVALRMDVAPAEVYGVASFYGMFSLEPRPPVVAHVCDDIACLTHGAEKALRRTGAQTRSRKFTLLRRPRRLVAQPMSRIMRARPGRADHVRRAETPRNE